MHAIDDKAFESLNLSFNVSVIDGELPLKHSSHRNIRADINRIWKWKIRNSVDVSHDSMHLVNNT